MKFYLLVLICFLGEPLISYCEEVNCTKDKNTGIIECEDGVIIKSKVKKEPSHKEIFTGEKSLHGGVGKKRKYSEEDLNGMKPFNPISIKRKSEGDDE